MILCCGEALIDMIPVELPDGDLAYRPLVGGAIFNTAISLGRLGEQVRMLSGVSTDLFGRKLEQALRDSGVGTDLLIRSDRPTTMAYVTLTNGHATYDFHDENTAGRMITPSELPELPGDIEALYFGGISLAVEPGAETYATLLADQSAGRAVMIDPNIRPGFIRDEKRYRDRIAGMIAKADIVKLSDDDLSWLSPGDAPLAAQARAMLNTGPSVVIITRGAAGADAYLASGQVVSVPAQRAKVVDTVGAGDTFNAGVLAALSEQGVLSKSGLRSVSAEVVEEALTKGAAVAAITVSRAGANPPWAEELAGD